MAIDTESKRRSALNVSLQPGLLLPAPDSAIGAGDRAQMCWCYRAFFDPAAAVRRMSALRVWLRRR